MSVPEIRLSARQQTVVDFGERAILVVAGPGSGKTRVLTERVRRLLLEPGGHFRVLALTFTNKAAAEMSERLTDLGELRRRAFIGTLHGFCLEMLAERGKLVGVTTLPQIFEQTQDRRQILVEAVQQDPVLANELSRHGDSKERARCIDNWLRAISFLKTHPISRGVIDDPLEERIITAYDAGLRASGAYDFDDLLLLSYQLLSENPKIADFYRRLYRYVCIDEAQDLNEAQYAVIQTLAGDDFHNVMMVGDPKQSIYGFNASGPEFMNQFASEFDARIVELTENFRSSQTVVAIAKALEPTYQVEGQLPIKGEAEIVVGASEADEAVVVADELERLIREGHPDIEGGVTPAKCAILGRTRFTLLAIEKEFKSRGIPYFKRVTSLHENESKLVDEFSLALRVLANPKDRLHLATLAAKWGVAADYAAQTTVTDDFPTRLLELAQKAGHLRCMAIVDAIATVGRETERINLMPGIEILRRHADTLSDEERRAVYDDLEVVTQEWDQYLRTGSPSSRSIGGFLSSMALGTTQQANADGAALLTVHSAKGLEFEVVFLVGMADGVFPDYRAQGRPKETSEERRNAFVAVTRSRRVLIFSYPKTRIMPWGDTRFVQPSPYLAEIRAAL